MYKKIHVLYKEQSFTETKEKQKFMFLNKETKKIGG